MPMVNLIKDFSHSFDLVNRLRSEMFVLNQRLVERDPITSLSDYSKAKATFKELRVAMLDLDRAVNQIRSEIPDLPPSYEIDQKT